MKKQFASRFLLLSIVILLLSNNVMAETEKNITDEYDIVISELDLPLNKCIWDGEKFIGFSDSVIRYSYDGIEWFDTDMERTNRVVDVIYNGELYTALCFLVPYPKNCTGIRNLWDYSNIRDYQIGVWYSEDGIRWTVISGMEPNQYGIGWAPSQDLFLKDDKIIAFISGQYFQSTNGMDFEVVDMTRSDPYGLAPDYLYLGGGRNYYSDIYFDGTYFISDYLGMFIQRSKDGINWEIVHVNEKPRAEIKLDNINNTQIFKINNKYYALDLWGQGYYISTDTRNWTKSNIKDTLIIDIMGEKDYSSDIRSYYPYITCINDYYIVVPLNNAEYENSILFSKDLINYVEFDLGTRCGEIIYLDQDKIITKNLVLDFNKIQELMRFSDVNPKDWYASNVLKLADLGIISGYNDGTYKPSNLVKVNEFIKMVVTSLGFTIESNDDDWSLPYIEKAIESGFILEDSFDDYNRQISRYEMAYILSNTLEVLQIEQLTTDSYEDVIKDYYSIPEEYLNQVLFVYEKGIITGYPSGEFKGEEYLMRSEASTVLVRFLNYLDE